MRSMIEHACATLGAAALSWSCATAPADSSLASGLTGPDALLDAQTEMSADEGGVMTEAEAEADAMVRKPRPLDRDGVVYVETEDPKHPLVRYRDGQLALSDSCAVLLGNKLNRRIPPAYVNGLAIGFC